MKNLLLLFLILFPFTLLSQESISVKRRNDKIIKFEISNSYFYVQFKENKSKLKLNNKLKFVELTKNRAIIKDDSRLGNFELNRLNLKHKYKDHFDLIEPVLIFKDSTKQICDGEMIIKLKDDNSIEKILGNEKYSIVENLFVEKQFLIKFENKSTKEIFEFINKINEDPKVEFAEPNFIRFLKPYTSDPFYNSQWSIRNQGYMDGTYDADMDIDMAWSFATGQGVKVAVIDEGVDLMHPDLNNNLLTGFDATGNNSNGAPNSNNNDSHGTCCAGIIGAVANNNIGIAGIAHNAMIIPIRIA